MERRLLIAVDDSLQSKYAVQYAGRLVAEDSSGRLDLIHIQPMISQFLEDEARKNIKAKNELNLVARKNIETSRHILSAQKENLMRSGVPENRIEVFSQPRKLGVAKDILDFAQERRYDAILAGRRGVSGLQEMIYGSISSNLLQHSQFIPIWLIDGERPLANVLVPVDGSTNSLRAVDHLAFIMAGQPNVRFTFLHVRPKLRQFCEIDFEADSKASLESLIETGDARCIDGFYSRAIRKLTEFGISEEQLEVKTEDGLGSAGSVIVKSLNSGEYDTVIMGRRGINRSYFTGSVTNHVLNKVSDLAVWIVP